MTDNNDDKNESALIININNTVNILLDGLATTTDESDSGTLSNLLVSDDTTGGDTGQSQTRGGLSRLIKDSLKSDQNGDSYFNTVNISPDARFFRAGKTDDQNSSILSAVRGALRAGKDGDGNPVEILRTIAEIVGENIDD